MYSVLIADDHPLVREGMRRVIEAEIDIKVVAEASDGEQAVGLIGRHRPDVVVLDITMPKLTGLEVLERTRPEHPHLKGILLSHRCEAALVQSAIALGTEGYLVKNADAREIVAAIRAVIGGGNYFSPVIAREIANQARNPSPEGMAFTSLSQREREVLRGIAEGQTAKEIAFDLSISTKTTEAHRASLMKKLEIRKATELVRYAVRHGIVDP